MVILVLLSSTYRVETGGRVGTEIDWAQMLFFLVAGLATGRLFALLGILIYEWWQDRKERRR